MHQDVHPLILSLSNAPTLGEPASTLCDSILIMVRFRTPTRGSKIVRSKSGCIVFSTVVGGLAEVIRAMYSETANLAATRVP